MQRLGEFDNKVIIEQHNEPENKNVIWKDPDENKYKEYVDGSWVESDKIATPGGGGGGGDFTYKYIIFDKPITINQSDWEYHPETSKTGPYYSISKQIADCDFDSNALSVVAISAPYFDDYEGYYDGCDIYFDDYSAVFDINIYGETIHLDSDYVPEDVVDSANVHTINLNALVLNLPI